MMVTQTGNFRIGMRQGFSDWQKDPAKVAQWAKQAGFELIDLGQVTTAEVKTVKDVGIGVVSVDMLDWPGLLSDDAGKRKDAVAANSAYFKKMAGVGIRVFFAVIIPENPDNEPKKNFDLAVENYGCLAQVAEGLGATIVLEGWPGGPPNYPNLCCNPETYRAILKEVPSPGLSINFDPSHLIRMGIDHKRFIDEFAGRVGHVHGKDTAILTDRLYDVGYYQQSVFTQPHGFGEYVWRYTIPGGGITQWAYVLKVLHKVGFAGAVSVELEDENYNGTEAGEKVGLLESLKFLSTV
ncbi:MAG: sugar phosphate isomerase/epimerase family protein [Planctomycetota bacterium]|jgi:sugar phosphate isomerase/epimerase